MIQTIKYMEGKGTNPYENLAIEEYLLKQVQPQECILYLWQNRHTVVIGRNQNAWKECLVSKLQEDNGYLVRRLSGGGAVFHDLGNLNFTFLVQKENYNLEKQLRVILIAMQKLGIKAEKSGRNDILIDGKKFSGNAYFETENHCYHHGTIMVNVNINELSKYLSVSKEKLQSKGVDSVKSRVTNLIAYSEDLTMELLKEKLVEAFEEVYEKKVNRIMQEDIDSKIIESMSSRFASWDWVFGKKIEFQYELSKRFTWGSMILQLQVKDGKVADIAIYSDSLKPELIPRISQRIKGCKYDKINLSEELEHLEIQDEMEREIIQDLISWFLSLDF